MTDHKHRNTGNLTTDSYSLSPSKKGSATHGKFSNSTGKQPTGMALKLNPFLSPKSDLAYRIETGQLSNREDISSARSRGSPGKQMSYNRKSITNLHSNDASILKSPQQKSSHHKTHSMISPNKSQALITGETSNSPKVEPSETVVRRFEEIKNRRDEKKRVGTEVYDTVNERKQIENQLSVLETRIKKLQHEEREMIKKINETANRTEKILDSKKRHQEDLYTRHMQNKAREDNLEKRRNEINQYRNESKTHLREAMLGNYKQKHDKAYNVKQENNYNKMLKDETDKATLEKNKTTIKKLNDQHNQFRESYSYRFDGAKNGNDSKYLGKLDSEKKKIDDLNDKYHELEAIEQHLLEKLSNTYSLHKSKINQLEKAFNLKVSATEPVEFDTQDDYYDQEEDDQE